MSKSGAARVEGKYSVAEVEQWLLTFLTERLAIPESAIDPHLAFPAYGLDSSALVGLTAELGEWLGQPLDPVLLYDFKDIHSLARAVGRDGAAS
jgi:acyl carrier protein